MPSRMPRLVTQLPLVPEWPLASVLAKLALASALAELSEMRTLASMWT